MVRPRVDAAAGLFSGFRMGRFRVLGVVALLSATLIPQTSDAGLAIMPHSVLKAGYGLRTALLAPHGFIPGLTLSWLRRGLPAMDMSGSTRLASVYLRDVSITASAWRVVPSERLGRFGVDAGYGRDAYTQTGDVQGWLSTVLGSIMFDVYRFSQSMNRDNAFVDASTVVLGRTLVAEIGRASGGVANTHNSFIDGHPSRPQVYGSFGVRIGF